MTVLFSVEPSHRPSGTLIPSGRHAQAHDAAAALQLDPVKHQRRQADVAKRPRHQRSKVLPGPADELARDGRPGGRALGVDDLPADRLTRAREAPRADAGQHLLQHHPRQRVAIGEVRIRRQPHLVLAIDGPRPRPADANTAPAQGDLAVLVAVAHRGPVGIALALRAHDLVDLRFHHLAQHAQTDADAQRQQPILRSVDEFAERLLHARRQRQLLAGDLLLLYGPHGGPFVSVDLFAPATVAQRPDEAMGPPPTKFHELRDNLLQPTEPRRPLLSHGHPSGTHLSAELVVIATRFGLDRGRSLRRIEERTTFNPLTPKAMGLSPVGCRTVPRGRPYPRPCADARGEPIPLAGSFRFRLRLSHKSGAAAKLPNATENGPL